MLDIWCLNLNINRFVLFNVKWNHFLNLYFLVNDKLLTIGFFNYDLNFFENLLSVSLNKVCHFHNNFFLYFFHNLFLLYDWHFNDFLLNNFIGHGFFNNLGHNDLLFLNVSNEFGNLSFNINYLSIGDNMRNISLDFNVLVFLEYFLADNLYLFNLLPCFL